MIMEVVEMNQDASYIARNRECGCIVGIVIDNPKHPDRAVQAVKEFMKDGLTIDRVSHDEYINSVRHEETFLNCPHNRQGSLL